MRPDNADSLGMHECKALPLSPFGLLRMEREIAGVKIEAFAATRRTAITQLTAYIAIVAVPHARGHIRGNKVIQVDLGNACKPCVAGLGPIANLPGGLQ